MYKTILIIVFLGFFTTIEAQTNATSIQSNVTFQWSDTQTDRTHPATIESITVGSNVYLNFGVPTSYEMTQLGPNGHTINKILENGTTVENRSDSSTWNATALDAFQSLNLNYYFVANGNGDNICDDYVSEETTNSQRQTLYYDGGIIASSSGIIAVTERNANNCIHIEFFGYLEGSTTEQSLGETFVNEAGTQYGFGGTGTGGPDGLGTPGAINPPPAGSDYWLSDRVIENRGTIGIALFYLNNIAPNGSLITKATITAASTDNGDGKLFILTFPDYDKDGISDLDDVDDDNDGILDVEESNGIDPSADHDVDGIPNYQDPNFCTLSSDGICANLDYDSDGIPNHFDIDTDNDGIPDILESQTTKGYLVPDEDVNKSGTYIGLWRNYGTGTQPIDTDSDGITDYLDDDSDADGTLDIQENGQGNSLSGADIDQDGLDNNFDGDTTFYDPDDKIETGTIIELAGIYGDADGDADFGGDLDFRDLFDVNPPANALLDFDGVDDYLSTDSFINGLNEITIMSWVKIDPANAGLSNAVIAGEGLATRIYVKNGNTLTFGIRTTAGSNKNLSGTTVPYNEWHHIAGTFSNSTGEMKIYVDGKEQNNLTDSNLVGRTLVSSANWNGDFEVGRMSWILSNKQYFTGNIDEVRVFDSALSGEQIQQMVYQEIQNNGGLVQGSVIPKDIMDTVTKANVSWSDLIAYFPMTDIQKNETNGISDSQLVLKLHNITTVQEQTAPMPYITTSDGSWTSESTWLHGDVWDIEDAANNKDWSIVQIENDITTSNSHTNLGLIISDGKSLTVNGDNKVENSYYLELNGSLELEGDSQLIQTENSDLVTSASGKLLRYQEGNSSVYWYNYWSSPVGSTSVSTLTDNNGSSNNDNNTDFNLGMLKQPNGSSFEFTNVYHTIGKISTYWLYTYKNGVTYDDWAWLDTTSPVEPGVGYTQKGTGNPGEQQYLFEGKPNNGTIIIPVVDTGGSGSVPADSKTDYLLGNPYPSALDIHKFIDDNIGVIDGTIQLWQQWSGSSHILNEYNGGYASVNKLGSTRAYQFVGIEGADNGEQDGTKTPTRYLPVGQGFMVEILTNGDVVFNNSQRVFIKESDADGSYSNGSVFFRGQQNTESENDNEDSDNEEPLIQKIRLEFNSVDGPQTKRELLLGFSDITSDEFDYGYDGKNTEVYDDDLNLLLDNENYTLQAYGPVTPEKIVPLALKASGTYNYRIKLTEIENFSEDQDIFIRDNLTDTYYDLRSEAPYEFLSDSGEFNDRLEIVFQEEPETLSTIDDTIEDLSMYYALNRKKLVVLNPNNIELKQIAVVNMLGQSVVSINNVFEGSYNEYNLQNLTTGAYVITLVTSSNSVITKKIIVK
ncbi:LamG-like jellyroll fold domain-containing protein [Winogradskyella tangerina]|uniref:LamG-like jellyroll fold domain-containing protein n=1 Tax=Winogradskyella tangerina TaxID=2023240 RepID=UPI000DBEA195|nr:LamG-like jellyroll fold domain-containing protein [Winogradskyella tangerina]